MSTSVAEEGLDVPEVDLVLFYEPVPTAIRSIQRKGRTGRQDEGRVVVLMAEDTRDEAYFWISRNREETMREELRALKGVADEIEAELDDGQTGLDQFEGAESASARADGDGGQPALEEFSMTEQSETETTVSPEKEEDRVEIVADQRELNSTISRDLSARDGLGIRLETLSVGDYVCSDRVVVERKTVSDFLDTLTGADRSLFEQVGDMVSHYERPVIIVEGEGDLYEERNVHPNAIRGALASLAVDFGVSLLRTSDESDTADLLGVLARREQESSDREASVHGEKTAKTLSEQQEYVVSSIAEVGPITARSLLEAFGSVEAVMTAEKEPLLDVEGVGGVTAERIREVVASEYDP